MRPRSARVSCPTRSSKTRIRHIDAEQLDGLRRRRASPRTASRGHRRRRRAPAHRGDDLRLVRQEVLLHRLGCTGSSRRAPSPGRSAPSSEPNPCSTRPRAAITAAADAVPRRLVDEHEAARLLDGLEDRRACRAARACAGRSPPPGSPAPPAARPRRAPGRRVQPMPTIVTSPPSRRTAASPNGTTCSPSGTSPCSRVSR